KNTQEALTIIENKSKVQTSRNKPQVFSASRSSTQDAHITSLTKQVEALLSLHRPVNSVQNGCETCGGPHAYYECQAVGGYTQEDALHERPQGALPSNTKPNPREQVNSIMTRSRLTTVEPSIPPPVPLTPRVEVEKEPKTLMDEIHITSPASTAHVPPPGVQPLSPPKLKEDPKPSPHQPKIPYPLRLNKTKLLDKNDVQISKFFKILKQLHFDISLMDALTQIPKFTKVLKDLLKDKEKLEELANTPMNVECSAILLNKADPRVPIILGRPFLHTARALVDLYKEKLPLKVVNEEVVFYTDKSLRNNSRDIHSVQCINIIDFSKDKMISGNPTPFSDSMVESSSSSPIPYGDSDSLVEETDTLLSHINDSFPEYETFCFDIEEKSSGSTTTHSNYSLPDYDAFYFDDDHIEEKSSGSTTTHPDFSLPEYDSFIFDILIDPFPPADKSAFYHEEFADELTHIISPPEYDYFYFDLEADPGEFTRVLKENIFVGILDLMRQNE
ncbi:hypothetical protein Tco_0614049, partial [Tanacetum coccineum]